jgi:hypothetical protein
LDFEHLNFDIVSNFGFRILAQQFDSFFQLSPDEGSHYWGAGGRPSRKTA